MLWMELCYYVHYGVHYGVVLMLCDETTKRGSTSEYLYCWACCLNQGVPTFDKLHQTSHEKCTTGRSLGCRGRVRNTWFTCGFHKGAQQCSHPHPHQRCSHPTRLGLSDHGFQRTAIHYLHIDR